MHGINNKNIIGLSNLTGDPTSSLNTFFTLTFANVVWLTCPKCQEHFRFNGYSGHLRGDSANGLRDIKYNYHSHFPSYTYISSVARDIAQFFPVEKIKIVIEGDKDYLKKIDSYKDEHILKPMFSRKDNLRVTRPHIHGIVYDLHPDFFWKILFHTKYFKEYWQPGCACYEPQIEKNNDWVYRHTIQEIHALFGLEYTNHEYINKEHKCIIPYKEKKPIGYYKLEVINDIKKVENYISKYIDKGGTDVQIF
jgi:hypothetical protein